MAGIAKNFDSLRFNRLETDRLTLALLLSLVLHLFAWSAYEADKKFGIWQKLHPHAKIKMIPKQPVVQNAEPVEFTFTDEPSPDAPQNAKYYSDKNSRAANPDASQDTRTPKLTGKQSDVPQTEDAPRTKISKPQPDPEPPAKEQQPTPAFQPGDWSQAKPQKPQEETRPRTLQQARAKQSNLRPSLQMQQDGGTHRLALQPSFDAKATPFGDYDRKFIDAVTDRWYDLLDSQKFALDRSGKVTLRFHLNYDGSISDMTVLENTVGDLLGYVCQEAISEPAPYESWPGDMRRMVGENFREITFTFYYY
jgi:outer membrane biosynthesis protein TonB